MLSTVGNQAVIHRTVAHTWVALPVAAGVAVGEGRRMVDRAVGAVVAAAVIDWISCGG